MGGSARGSAFRAPASGGAATSGGPPGGEGECAAGCDSFRQGDGQRDGQVFGPAVPAFCQACFCKRAEVSPLFRVRDHHRNTGGVEIPARFEGATRKKAWPCRYLSYAK